MKKATYPVQMSAAICAAALLLAACGSSTDGPSSSQSLSTSAVAENNAGHPAKKSKEMPSARHANPDPKAKETKHATDNADPTPKKSHAAPAPGSGSRTESQKPVHVDGCVKGMTKSQCRAVGKAYEQQRGSAPDVVKEGECPGGLSEQECRQAGEAIEEGQEGRVIKPNECPQAMTAEQCAEAGKAYEEVTK
jgi:hypothetical protein